MPQISFKTLMNTSTPTYTEEIAKPFREELTNVGFTSLLTPADVDSVLDKNDDKIILLVLNSVCGCAAGRARPGVVVSMMNNIIPDAYVTLFAGMEKEAVNYFREKYLSAITPASPNIALFKNGKLQHIIQRYQIEGRSAGEIAKELVSVYDQLCSKKNSPEEIDALKNYVSEKFQINIQSVNI